MESLKNDSMQKGRVKVPEIYDKQLQFLEEKEAIL